MGRNKTIDDREVLTAAREVFRQFGHAASTRDVARAAGISQAVLYQRFASKDELFFRAMTPDSPDIEALLGTYPPKDAYAHLRAIGEALLVYLRTFMPTLLKVLAFPGVDAERLTTWHTQLPFMPISDAITARFKRMTADGLMGTVDAHVAAVTFMSTIHSLAFFEMLTTPGQRTHRKANLDAILKVLWQGFAPQPSDKQSAILEHSRPRVEPAVTLSQRSRRR